MNKEEYQNKVKIINNKLEDLQEILSNNRTNLENDYDNKNNSIKKRIEQNDINLNFYKNRIQETINNMEHLHSSREDSFVGRDDYQTNANKVYETREETLEYYQNKDNQLHQEQTDLKRIFDSQEDELLLNHSNNKNKLEDELDYLEDEFKKSND